MLLTVEQVAERLAVSKRHVWRLSSENPRFPKPARISPQCLRWRADEIETWLAERFAAA